MRRGLAMSLVTMLALAGLVAAAPAQARPVKPRPVPGEPAKPVEILAYGTAVCLVTVGRWQITWQFELHGDEARIIDARDHLNDNTALSWTTEPLSGWAVVSGTATGGLAGARTTAGLTAQILVTGEVHPRTVVRTLPLGAACVSEAATPDCTGKAQASYAHTFDGVAGTTTVEIVGPRLCPAVEQYFVLDSWYWHEPESKFDKQALNYARFNTAVRRIALSTATSRCKSRVALAVGFVETLNPDTGELVPGNIAGGDKAPGNQSTGPFAGTVVDSGTCLAPKAYAASRCDGSLAITVTNAVDAGMPATILISPALAGIELYRWISVPPSATVTVLLAKPGVPLGFHVQARNTVLGTFYWQRPASCYPLKPLVRSGPAAARRYSI